MRSKHARRIFGALLIVASLFVASIPTNTVSAETKSESKESDFEINGNVLVKYTGTASTVSVPATIKEIGEEAFSDNVSMTEIKLPNTLEKISYAAFSGCNNLKQVIVPDSVKEIGTAAFCNCSSLTSVDIGKNVKNLGTGVFTGCSLLSVVSGNDYFKCIDGAIYDKSIETLYELLPNAKTKRDPSSNDLVPLTTYKMPDSVSDIKPYALYGCRNIDEIIFSNYLKEIPAYSFSYCNSLTSLKIPYSVDLIDMKAFEYCINLEDVNIPASIDFIHKTAFDGCPKLNIIAPEDSYAYAWFSEHDNSMVNIIDTEDSDSEDDLSENESGSVPKIDGLIGETVIVDRQAVFFIDNSDYSVVSGKLSDPESYADIISDMENVLQTETNGKGLSLPKFSVINDVIAGRAYYKDLSLKTFDFPENITSIGDFAFSRSGLASIEIPSGVTSVGYGAFYHCDDLATISIPDTVTEIGPSAFDETRMMENWRLYGEGNFLIMGDGILVAYKGSGNSVTIPDYVKKIGPGCFKENILIKSVYIPDSVTEICEEAFYGCTSLKGISGANNLKVIEDRAFYGCPIDTVRLPDSLEAVGMGAFSFSNSNVPDAYKTAVFFGDSLPKASYNMTTTRLTNSKFRVDSLDDVKVCVVNSEQVDRVGTILDRSESGFSGLICVIENENDGYFNGTLKIIDCTLSKDEASKINIPSTVYLFDKGYNFKADELEAVLNMAKEGAYFEDISLNECFSFEGSKEKYELVIEKDSIPDSSVKEAYIRIYGDTVPSNFTTYMISLKDIISGCPITKFGKQKLPISIELPDNIPTANLHVICIDEDMQLEDLPFSVVTKEGGLNINFDISHTGKYGLYAFNSSSVSKFKLDDSPDTGDYIQPKWFLTVFLMAFGLIMIFYREKIQIKSEG